MTKYGRYTSNPERLSQDRYLITPTTLGDNEESGKGLFFAVFDGHGEFGHDSADFSEKCVWCRILYLL